MAKKPFLNAGDSIYPQIVVSTEKIQGYQYVLFFKDQFKVFFKTKDEIEEKTI
jgi:hypothetical protein